MSLAASLAGVTPGVAGTGERHAGPASERQPLLLVVQAKEVHPGLGAAPGDPQSEAGVTLVEMIDLPCGWRLEALDGGRGEGSIGH